jgi:hypothetical protein
MLSSRLIVALCDTYDDSVKFVHFNQGNSLIGYMEQYREGFKHVCGQPKSGEKYLVIDCELTGIVPDVLFEHTFKDKKAKTLRYYAYHIEDIMSEGNRLFGK